MIPMYHLNKAGTRLLLSDSSLIYRYPVYLIPFIKKNQKSIENMKTRDDRKALFLLPVLYKLKSNI